jgi:hypothetical protein
MTFHLDHMIKVDIPYSYRFQPLKIVYFKNICIGDGMAIELASCLIERVFEPQMGTNCASPLADLFLYSYEADFIQGLLKKKKKRS